MTPLYQDWVRPLLFRGDAEAMHDRAIRWGARLQRRKALVRWLARRYTVHDPRLRVAMAGLNFPNPIGLAAGYDKNGHSVETLAALGFGAIEVGSVSAEASPGNPPPRLWRSPADRAIIVNYGLPNDGAAAIAERLSTADLSVPLGVNVVKTNRRCAEPDEAILADYVEGARLAQDACDYLVLNLSCPNTESGRDFFAGHVQTRTLLELLDTPGPGKPVFLKVSPLGGDEALDQLLEAADAFPWVAGFIFNLPPGKPVPLSLSESELERMPGAVAGKPVEGLIEERIAALYHRMDRDRYRIIAAGGVFTGEDALRKIRLGASFVQIFTALIYEGPGVVRRINLELLELLERDGFGHIGEAVGVDVP